MIWRMARTDKPVTSEIQSTVMRVMSAASVDAAMAKLTAPVDIIINNAGLFSGAAATLSSNPA